MRAKRHAVRWCSRPTIAQVGLVVHAAADPISSLGVEVETGLRLTIDYFFDLRLTVDFYFEYRLTVD